MPTNVFIKKEAEIGEYFVGFVQLLGICNSLDTQERQAGNLMGGKADKRSVHRT